MRERVLITSQIDSGSGFAVVLDGEYAGDAVYIAPKTMKASGASEGDTLLATLLPNQADQRDKVPWFAPFVSSGEVPDTPPEAVRAALSAFDYPVSAEDAGLSLGALYAAHSEGMAVKVTAVESPTAKPVTLWAVSMEVV